MSDVEKINLSVLATMIEKFPDYPVVFVGNRQKETARIRAVAVGEIIEWGGNRYINLGTFFSDYFDVDVNHVWLKAQTDWSDNKAEAWEKIHIHMNDEAQKNIKQAIIVALA